MKLLDDSLYAVERELERDSVKRGVDRYKRLAAEAETRGDGASLKASDRLLVHWFALYRKAIRKERRGCEERRAGVGRGIYGQYMRLLNTDKTAVIAMHTTLGICLANPAGIHDIKVVLAIGRNLCAQMTRARFHRKDREPWNALMHTDRKQIRPKGVLKVARKFFPEEIWPLRVQGKIGAMLLKLLLGVATVEDQGVHYPAFDHYMLRRKGRRYYHLRLTQEADKVIRDGHIYRQILFPRYEPMVVRPLKWAQDARGGYIEQEVLLVKKARGYRAQDDLPPDVVLDAVNAVSGTPWRINRPVLKVGLKLRDQGGNVPSIPRQSEIEKPPKPLDFDTNEDAKKEWKREAARTRTQNVMLKGERKVAWHKFDIAERFQKYDRIYFPHDLDFRTRAYPVPLFLNHQGDDLCRGLLEFADARDVDGERARRWMMVHMANCCGQDKTSFDDRVEWVNSQWSRAANWVDDPLGNDDWLKVDKPFQALACAFAIHRRGPTYASHLPVQIDGTCNGLQHYAAMLRCPETAMLANLMPSDKPSDAYTDVAAHTLRLVGKDADAGNEYALKLEGWVTRNVVKQTVMTNMYGVTAVGARRQIHEWLVKAGFEDDELYQITRYLSHVVRQALSRVCVAAHDAMVWLARCARLIAKSGQPIRWRTPLGMRVVQPYRNPRRFRIETLLHTFLLEKTSADCAVHVAHQVSGFAPNFVHSIDASHMMMVARRAHDAGITFAAVHDGFWTHAADMDALGRHLRETFVELHKEPLLDVLHEQLKDMYPAITFPPPPATGTFDVSQVLSSEYAFS